MEKVSIIVPVYNVERYLDKCMTSLVEQTYSNIEIVLVDDGSKDKSGEICDKWAAKDARVIVIHKENGGLSDARNHGIRNSNGKYIVCVDSDDYVDSDYIEYLYSLIVKHNTKMSICQHKVMLNDTISKDYGHSGEESIPAKECIERMLYHDVIDTSAWAKMYERSLFNTVEYPFGKTYEDIATTYKLMMQCPTIAVGYESKYYYIVRRDSIVNCEFNERKLDLLDMTDEMGVNILKAYPDLETAVLRRRVYARFSTLNQMLQTDKYSNTKNEIIKFIKDNGKSVVKNPKTPRRDKIAYYTLKLGENVYRFAWNTFGKK